MVWGHGHVGAVGPRPPEENTPMSPPAVEQKAFGELTRNGWKELIAKIKTPEPESGCICTPILGPELPFRTFSNRAGLVEQWAEKLGYPFEDCHDLPRVAQFAATRRSSPDAKAEFMRLLEQTCFYDLDDPEDPHRILASLPFPFYCTTNYDSSMVQALQKVPSKQPQQKLFAWNDRLLDHRKKLKKKSKSLWEFPTGFRLHPAMPVVFHLYGCGRLALAEDRSLNDMLRPSDSLVLTEDDYLDFLLNVGGDDNEIVPGLLGTVFTGTALLLLGYRLRDLEFRILLRFLHRYLRNSRFDKAKVHLCVQLEEEPARGTSPADYLRPIKEFCNDFYNQLLIDVYWGTSRQFLTELKKRWEEAGNDE
jgi:hypothetical protein